MIPQHVSHPFDPVYDERSQVLILGSFPSVKSREQQFYYGHPRNRFWAVLAACFDEETPTDIPAKKAFLLSHGLALWDVIDECDITGSSDASVRNARPVDLRRILNTAPIRVILCNGALAGRLYQKHLYPLTQRPAQVLPSTSPANAGWNTERLLSLWRPAVRHTLYTPCNETAVIPCELLQK